MLTPDDSEERTQSSSVEAARSRKIIHIDMDAFYASVEQRDDPELRDAVSMTGRRGASA